MFDEKQDEASVCFLRGFDKSLLRWMERGRLWSENSAPGIRRAFADEISQAHLDFPSSVFPISVLTRALWLSSARGVRTELLSPLSLCQNERVCLWRASIISLVEADYQDDKPVE